MKKLLITTAALTLGLSTATNLVSESQAASTGKAPTKSAYCDLAKSQRNPVSWNAQYGCLDKERVAAARAEARPPATNTHAKNPYCDMAKSQRNPVSWNAQYGCLDKERVAAARAEARPPAKNTHAKSPYCDMAKSQRNPVSWNARYNCLASR